MGVGSRANGNVRTFFKGDFPLREKGEQGRRWRGCRRSWEDF
jgi:hypothetical protein